MSKHTDRRPLTEQEIDALIENSCSAGDWGNITVSPEFSPAGISSVHFAGKVSIGNKVIIRNVSESIANYDIGDEVVISDVRALITFGQRSFGNGVRVAAVNENGGRAIPIFAGLNSQIAYLTAMYRHDAALIEKLEAMAANVAAQKTSKQGCIGDGVHVSHCDVIQNVNIGPWARLEGVSRLENGTILSWPDDRCYVGTNVIAKDFIFAEGAHVTDATRLNRCFVGQRVRLENGFSAVDSVFFANSHFEQGEACSVFAGPFSVSHHKSTLLIAGMFSFYNAGSGTNQSNHMYKLGPMHQGILERGCKTGSESYLMWPSRIGAFSTVIGKHSKRLDTANLPFSVLLERQGRSELYVGLNLTNVGLVRDGQKWPQRDKRKMPNPADQVNANVFTPYTAQKMLAGIELLTELNQKHAEADNVLYHGVSVRTPASGIELYQLAMDQYFGDTLLRRLGKYPDGSISQRLQVESAPAPSQWADIAGLIAPMDAVSGIADEIKTGQIQDIAAIRDRFQAIGKNYDEHEWAWVAGQLQTRLGKPVDQWQGADIAQILQTSLAATEKLVALQIEDAAKEFDLTSRIGYGIDGDSDTQTADFTATGGTADTNPTIRNLKELLEQKKVLVEKIIQSF